MNATALRPHGREELNHSTPPATIPQGVGEPASGEQSTTRAGELAITALMLLPGALIVFTGFNAGGYFPTSTAIVVIVLAQILLVRIVQAPRPFAGFAPSTLIALVALALYALLTLLSASWSHSNSRALIEFDRAWLYLLILLLYGTIRPSTQQLRWFLRGLVLGMGIVCIAGLISRVLPDFWHTAPDVANQRLSYPVTYWNTLGLLAALGIVLAFHLVCTLGERRLVRVLAAALVPLLAVTLFFTFSRGAIVAGAIGLAVYMLVARPNGLLSGALASVPGTVALLVVAYHANLLDTVDPTTPAAVSQGHRVALAAGICATACGALRLLLAIVLDPRLQRSAGWPRLSSRSRRGAGVGIAAALVLAGLALGLPHTVARDWNRFMSGAPTHGSAGDLRQRLSDPSNDGRTDLWRVALHDFTASPGHGQGAGTYQTSWDRQRPRFAYVINAHSLYLQAMAELGLPGLLLLLALIGATLVGLGTRARGSRRSLYGVLLAAGVVWALHAGVDWDWEMPVVTLGFFAAAGLALSPRGRSRSSLRGDSGSSLRDGPRSGWVPGRGARLTLGVLCLAGVVLPVLIIGSQRRLGEAEHALYASNCTAASSAALSSIGWLDVRPEPYEILGFCDVQRGLPRQGVAAMRQAVRLDPGSWETYYALAIAQAAAGIDPRRNAEKALQMNPFEPLTREAARELRVSGPTEWVRRAGTVRASALASNDLSLVPS
jgi:O-Antigen ligase